MSKSGWDGPGGESLEAEILLKHIHRTYKDHILGEKLGGAEERRDGGRRMYVWYPTVRTAEGV